MTSSSRRYSSLVVLALVFAACSPSSSTAPGIDLDRVMVHVGAMMVLGPRAGDTDSSKRAALYIDEELGRAGIVARHLPVGAVDLPEIEVLGQIYRSRKRAETTFAVSVLLAIGLLLFAIGAAELAWVWLVPAAIVALAPRLGPVRPISAIAALLPVVLVLAPAQLREAAWNRILSPGQPLAPLLIVLGTPAVATLAYLLRRRPAVGPLGAFALPLGCLLSAVAGVLLLQQFEPPCSAGDFNSFHLACEQIAGVP